MYVPGLSSEELFAEHKRFAENYTRDISPPEEGLRNDTSPNRPLRIGYLSSDFRDHPVGRNVLPLLTSHDREQFEIYCYADVRHPDTITDKFRSSVDHWYSITGKSDAEVAAMVRADKIDVLVCLAGRFDHNRPLVCAHRAAPVQVSFHDAATSGLEEMDYWLTDAFLNPPDTKEKFTEDLYRLPVFYQYTQIEDAPPVVAPPSEQAGFITFGSFNNPAKVNTEVIELWSKVLKAVPNSRLLLKYKNWYEQELLRENMLSGFSAYGVERDRIKFADQNDTMFEYLGGYKEVDIALDPFPFNGATTTFQALWMGVPVITLAGGSFNSRTAGSILYHSGLDDLIVDTPEDYIACARALAADGARLGKLRSSLREQIIRSPLCDAPAYALTVESAYREMWQTWCAKIGDNR